MKGFAARGLWPWMMRASRSLPVPVGPSMSTVAGVGTTTRSTSKTCCTSGLSPTKSSHLSPFSASNREASWWDCTVMTPPAVWPSRPLRAEAATRTGSTERPSCRIRTASRGLWSSPLAQSFFSGQSPSHNEDFSTSRQVRPRAFSASTPQIWAAAPFR